MDDRSSKPTRLADGDALDEFVAANEIALVEFYTAGCSRCHAMEPVLGNVARVTDVAIGLVNPGDDIALVDRFDIDSVPTLVLFEGGDEIDRIADGFQQTEAVISVLNESVPDAVEPDHSLDD